MPRGTEVPEETMQRMLSYLRELDCMMQAGKHQFSSQSLAQSLRMNPAQIRKDFSYFGEFGTRGVGYDTERLAHELRTQLNLDRTWRIVLIGVGNIGLALLKNPELRRQGFEIVLAVDADPRRVGKRMGGMVVEATDKLVEGVRAKRAELAIIATPVECAQGIADALIDLGIKGILSFAPCHLHVPDDVGIVPIDIPMALGKLVYRL